jgi:hypothetical protein
MDIVDSYLAYLCEKLEDITTKKKWYDIMNSKLRKLYQSEMKKIFDKYFVVRHPLINNAKTKVEVSLPLIGYNYYVTIYMYDKKGKDIFDYEAEANFMDEPLVIQIQKKGNKWDAYYHTLFLKDIYQGKKLGPAIIKSVDTAIKQLQRTKVAFYQSVDVGRYVWSRVKGVQFKNRSGPHSHQHTEKNYQLWCDKNNNNCKAGRTPSDYPKEYLLSKDAPEFIDYNIPIG